MSGQLTAYNRDEVWSVRVSAKIFYDEQLKDRKRRKLRNRLEKDQKVKKVQLILRIDGDQNLLHLMSPSQKDRLLKRQPSSVVVGIAKDREGAFKVIENIVMQVLDAQGAITGDLIDKELDIHWNSSIKP